MLVLSMKIMPYYEIQTQATATTSISWARHHPLCKKHDQTMAGTVLHPPQGRPSPSIFRGTFCAAKHAISCIRYLSKTHFVRDLPQKVKVEDMKTKLSCEMSLKNWNLKLQSLQWQSLQWLSLQWQSLLRQSVLLTIIVRLLKLRNTEV